jgi:hypothetical protein
MDGMDLDSVRPKVPGVDIIMAAIKATLLLGIIFWIVIPSQPFPLGTGLDASWIFGLNMGHFDRMVFGRDIVFTYGPLGYLVVPTFPEAEPWAVLVFAWGIASAAGYALWRLCKSARHWTEICLYLGVFWVYSGFAFDSVERMLGAVIALTLAIASSLDARPWFDLGLLFFLAGITLLVKFNLGMIGSLAAFYFAACLVWRGRSTPRLVLRPAAAVLSVWLFTLLGLYWMLDGTLGGIAAFLRNSIEVASGYSGAMGTAGPLWVAEGAVASCFVLWIAAPLAAGSIRRVAWGMPPLIVISFLCFKSAMVRQDAHALPFPFQMAAVALLVVAFGSSLRSRIVVGVFAVASLALGVATVRQLWPEYLPIDADRLTGRAAVSSLNGFLHWRTAVDALQATTQRAGMPDQLPPGFWPYVQGKSVAAYPWEIARIRTNHLRWRPLPVMQAYSAYTPALDSLNAKNLEDASGPEAILLSWESIDGRQPFYETPRSWRAMLNWYDLKFSSEKVCVLNRRSTPRFGAAMPSGTAVAHWNETITLPSVADDEALVMEADVAESLEGILKRELFRSAPVTVRATMQSGFVVSRSAIRINLRDGVVVSDWPDSLGAVASMMAGSGSFTDDRVVSISFNTYAQDEFQPAIRIRWSRVKLLQPVT